MRISDWSSDVCSSALTPTARSSSANTPLRSRLRILSLALRGSVSATKRIATGTDRKSVGEGKRVSVRVDLGGRRISKKKKSNITAVRHLTEVTDLHTRLHRHWSSKPLNTEIQT